MDQLYAAGFTFLVLGVFIRLFLEMVWASFPAGLGAVALPFAAAYLGLTLIVMAVGILRNRQWKGATRAFGFGTQFVILVVSGIILGLYVNNLQPALSDELASGVRMALLSVTPYAIIFVMVNLIRGFYAVWDNDGDIRGMLNSLYVVLVVRYLIPIKFNRLFVKGITPRNYRWGGR